MRKKAGPQKTPPPLPPNSAEPLGFCRRVLWNLLHSRNLLKNVHTELQRLCRTLGAKPRFSDPANSKFRSFENQKGLEVFYCLWGVPSRPSPGSCPGPVQVPSRVRGGPVQIRHVLCFTVFRTHPGPEVGAIPARPGPILLPSVPCRIRPGRAETDFLATSEKRGWRT